MDNFDHAAGGPFPAQRISLQTWLSGTFLSKPMLFSPVHYQQSVRPLTIYSRNGSPLRITNVCQDQSSNCMTSDSIPTILSQSWMFISPYILLIFI